MSSADANDHNLRHLIRILVFIDDAALMDQVVESLQYHGYAEITRAHDPDELGMTLRLASVDLVIAVSRTERIFIGDFIRDLRHGLLDCHPFPVVLMLLPSAEAPHVRAVIDAGVDDLLITPLQGDTLIRRLGTFLIERRPFTVTHDYIGPNRRVAHRPGTQEAPLVLVPNPVRARAYGQDEAILQEVLEEATLSLNRLKIQTDSQQIGWLLDRLEQTLAAPEHDIAARSEIISQIAAAAAEISRRAKGASASPVRDMARSVIEATRAIIFTQELITETRTRALLDAGRKLTDRIANQF
jgi:DNA-binding response OmpR family regulator